MQASPVPVPQPRVVGRYALYGEIAAGGMATVHFGRLVGAVGFSRTVAIKRLHAQFAKDPDFVTMFLDEARLAARIQHPNVVSTLDVVPLEDEVFLVMEYVHGEALSKLIRSARRSGELVPPRVAVAIVAGALHGLHAAHEAKSERGEPLNIVHRDISPQNILVGTDGAARVLDFGVAKAAARVTSTRDGQMKGKVSYMAPEQLRGKAVDRRTDVFAAGVVLWETLTGRRLFDGEDPGEILAKLLEAVIPPPSTVEPSVPAHLDALVMRALDRNMENRWPTAREFAIALEHAGPIALAREVGEWVERVGEETLGKRARQVAEIESGSVAFLRAVEPVSSSSHPSPVAYPAGVPPAAQPFAPVPTGWPVGQQADPITSPSQVSHVTGISHPSLATAASGLSAVAAPPQRRRLHAALAGVAVALALGVLVLGGVLITRRKQPEEAVEPPAVPGTVAATTEGPSVTAEPGPEPSGVAPPAPTADRAPSATPFSASPPLTKPPVVTGKKPVGGMVRPPADGCDPPYVIDKNGIKRVKPGCM